MKITRNVLLIGIVAGLLIYCMINDCSIKEGMTYGRKKRKKNKFDSFTHSAATLLVKYFGWFGTFVTNTILGAAKIAGKGVNVLKKSGKIFTNHSNRKSSV